jgi:phosphate:Na+ symporter
MLIGLVGGLGLFLYGMKIMGDGLQNVAGDRLRAIFRKITSNPIKGVLTGIVVTSIIQSSSATTVMVVGFVNAGLMSLYQAAGVIMGANVGTTVTGQLVALNLTAMAPIFIAIGSAIVLFAEGENTKEVGNIILGLGILFIGMNFMQDSMAPLAKSQFFKDLTIMVSNNILLGVLVGLCMTAVVQSSSATIGILIALATTGALPLKAALPILFGDNIGTCATALISSIGTSKTAQKTAIFHLSFNIIGTILFSCILVPLTPFVDIVTNLTPGNVPRQIANAHTLFNLINVIIQVPFVKYIVNFVNKVVPGKDEHEEIQTTKYIDNRFLETPVIAVGQTVKELIRMANKAKENLQISVEGFSKNDKNLVNKVYKNENLINILEKDITNYLVKLSNTELSKDQIDLVTSMFHVVKDVERIGDHAENIADLTCDVINKNVKFSQEAIEQLNELYVLVIDALDKSIESFRHNDSQIAQEVMYIEEKIDNLREKLRESNIKRLSKGVCSANNSAIFLDIISNFERIGDHATNVAEVVLNKLS